MATIYLKYTTWNKATSSWNAWSSSLSFSCLDLDKKSIQHKISGETLRKVMYSNSLAQRKKWIVVIGADVLYSTTEMGNVESFWDAQRWKLSEDNWSTEYEVVIPEEELQKARTANHKGLPKVTIEMFQKNPTAL
jgi:hypothetical protein